MYIYVKRRGDKEMIQPLKLFHKTRVRFAPNRLDGLWTVVDEDDD